MSIFKARWKLLLGYLGPRRSSWTTTLAQKRALYQQFIEELVLPPGHSCNGAGEGDGDGDVAVDSRGVGLQDHPLSEGPESAWNTFFNDMAWVTYRARMRLCFRERLCLVCEAAAKLSTH
ncbi:GL20953 [Drosophila persimilis]|uniref:GL20953 n=1 Tax=Drosophila persimilis TaxID=7234 RepID=B4IR35_DROPE|nr:GL20953 [Drosophila persimilis]